MKTLMLLLCVVAAHADELEKGFVSPPASARPWCYWWWLNGAASKEGITRDFEEMRDKGIGGALLFDAGQAGPEVPRGPEFMSAKWRELYKHALREAERCGLVLSVNLCSGWNAGGPWVTPEYAAKKLVSTQVVLKGPGRVGVSLKKPEAALGFYRDIAVIAAPMTENAPIGLHASSQYEDYGPALARDGLERSRWVSNGNKPGMGPTPQKPEFLQFSYEKPRLASGVWLKPYLQCGPKEIEVLCSDDGQSFRSLKRATLKPQAEATISFEPAHARHFRVLFLSSYPFQNAESWNVQVAEIRLLSNESPGKSEPEAQPVWDQGRALDVSRHVNADGRLDWDVPAGRWQVLRIGYTLLGRRTAAVGSGPGGLEIDTMSAAAMDAHFAETGAKLIAEAGPLVGKTLQYFHLDSWELGQPTWTPGMREEFQRRRGYDLLLCLPAMLGQKLNGPAETGRFVQDFRRTIADLVADNYYGRMAELTTKGGLLGTHSESGGPGHHWIDALQCEGRNMIPMGEFWNRQYEPDGPICLYGPNNYTVKQAASAAHIYGRSLCQAEAFTSTADDFTEDPWCMKDIGDSAFCDGLTRQVLCFWVHQPRLDVKPGDWWVHVGARFSHTLTWWPMAGGWLTYLARCQHMLRQGVFVADFAYLQSEAIPSFTANRFKQQPPRPAGFDYDALNSEVLLTRASAKNGRLTLPDGMSYRYLVLPDGDLAPATLKTISDLAEAGVTVVGPKTFAASVPKLREGSLDSVVKADGLLPDIEFHNPSAGARFDWIHRRSGETDIYFISNQSAVPTTAEIVFRVAGTKPELWDAVMGEIRDLPEYRVENGRTAVPMRFEPRQSWFVVFRESSRLAPRDAGRKNFLTRSVRTTLTGPWEVSFDPQWGGPARVTFDKLEDWTKRPEDGIRFYSGIARYRKTFDSSRTTHHSRCFLDLGLVKNLARVFLNGRDLGVVWCAPWQVEITDALKTGSNSLEIQVANLWPNRLIGDGLLPKEQRRTISNVRTYDAVLSNEGWTVTSLWGRSKCQLCSSRLKSGKPAELLPSGLLGPVRVMVSSEQTRGGN